MKTPVSRHSLSIPGKFFLLGEYAVLADAPAWIVAVPPRFEIHEASSIPNSLHPESPAGRLMRYAQQQGRSIPGFAFHDPHSGQGGLGASTAQFALLFKFLNLGDSWQSALKLYRQLHSASPLPPSGADLVAQWCGGWVEYLPASLQCNPLQDHWLPARNIMLFSATGQANRKVATHEHLNQFETITFKSHFATMLAQLSKLMAQAPHQFETSLQAYGDTLREHGFEHPATTADKTAFLSLDGVVAAKGTGALQADGLIIITNGTPACKEAVKTLAHGRKLKLISDGLPDHEGGIHSP